MLIPNLGVGGAQRVFRDHSAMLGEHYRVVDVAFNATGAGAFASGNPLLTLDVAGGGGPLDKLLNLRRRVAVLRRIKRASGARLCISHMPGADYVNLLSTDGERTVAVVHGSKQGDRNIRGLSGILQNRVLQPLLYRRADRVVAVSRDIEHELIGFGVAPPKVLTINNFFDDEAIRAASAVPLAPAEKAIFGADPVLANTGRLHPQKNHVGLIEVFAQLRRQRPVRLVILGDGELRETLVSRAEELGLSTWAAWRDGALAPGHDLYLLGSRPNPFQWLAHADLFVFSSSWEGFPLALCEAMICGLPVVSTDCRTGPREILAPDTGTPLRPIATTEPAEYGLLMPLLDAASPPSAATAWVDALGRLLDDPAGRRRLGMAARDRMQDFTRDRIAGQWLGLVADLLASSRSTLVK